MFLRDGCLIVLPLRNDCLISAPVTVEFGLPPSGVDPVESFPSPSNANVNLRKHV